MGVGRATLWRRRERTTSDDSTRSCDDEPYISNTIAVLVLLILDTIRWTAVMYTVCFILVVCTPLMVRRRRSRVSSLVRQFRTLISSSTLGKDVRINCNESDMAVLPLFSGWYQGRCIIVVQTKRLVILVGKVLFAFGLF